MAFGKKYYKTGKGIRRLGRKNKKGKTWVSTWQGYGKPKKYGWRW